VEPAVAPVPETSTYVLFIIGLGAVGLMNWKRKKQTRPTTGIVATA
jgi:hypothetical protein